MNLNFKIFSKGLTLFFLIVNLFIIFEILYLCDPMLFKDFILKNASDGCIFSDSSQKIFENSYLFYLFSLFKIISFLYLYFKNNFLNYIYLISEGFLNLIMFINIDKMNFLFISFFTFQIFILKILNFNSIKKYINEFVYILLFLNTLGVYIVNQITSNFSIFRNRWVFKEMIITYFGSFHRRGALGSILHLQSSTFEDLILNSFIFTVILEIVVTFLLFRLIRNFDSYFKFLILLLPFGFVFHLKVEEFGRKDALLIILFIVFLNLMKSNNIKLRRSILTAFCLFGCFVILVHESLFFFLPFYFLVNFRYRKSRLRNLNEFDFILFFFAGLSFLMLTIFKSLRIPKENYRNAMFEIYNNDEILNCCISPIEYLNAGPRMYLTEIQDNLSLPFLYNWGILFFLIVFICFFISRHFSFSTNSWLLILFVFPLFIVAQDWGRWINLYFLHFILTELYIVENIKKSFKSLPKIFMFCILIFMFIVIPTGPQQVSKYGFSLEFLNIRYFYEAYYDNVFEYGIKSYKE